MDGKSTHIPYRDSKLTRLLQGNLNEMMNAFSTLKKVMDKNCQIWVCSLNISKEYQSRQLCSFVLFLFRIVLIVCFLVFFICFCFADEIPLSLL